MECDANAKYGLSRNYNSLVIGDTEFALNQVFPLKMVIAEDFASAFASYLSFFHLSEDAIKSILWNLWFAFYSDDNNFVADLNMKYKCEITDYDNGSYWDLILIGNITNQSLTLRLTANNLSDNRISIC